MIEYGDVQAVMLGKIIVSVKERASREMLALAQTVEGEWVTDHLRDALWLNLRASVLAEQLPPQTIRQPVRISIRDPRHASWWDMWKATYRGCWWARWLLRSKHWRIETVDTVVTVAGESIVNVHDHWTYPRAPRLEHLAGTAVMVSTYDHRFQEW